MCAGTGRPYSACLMVRRCVQGRIRYERMTLDKRSTLIASIADLEANFSTLRTFPFRLTSAVDSASNFVNCVTPNLQMVSFKGGAFEVFPFVPYGAGKEETCDAVARVAVDGLADGRFLFWADSMGELPSPRGLK